MSDPDPVTELKAALEPFARAAQATVTMNGAAHVPADSDVLPAGPLTWGDVRRAHDALLLLELLATGLTNLAKCRRDRDQHYLFLADIRAASGLGAAPMMTDLPAELRKLRQAADALPVLKALIAVRPWNWDDEVDDPEGYRAWRDAEELLRRLGEMP